MSRQKVTSRHVRPRAGLLFLVGALVVGVLGMHALSSSCAGSVDQTSMAMGSSGPSVAQPHHLTSEDHPVVAQEGDPDGSPTSHPMVSICLAVLLMLGSLWAAEMLRRRGRGWRIGPVPISTPISSFASTSRPRPPPGLAQLSILRC